MSSLPPPPHAHEVTQRRPHLQASLIFSHEISFWPELIKIYDTCLLTKYLREFPKIPTASWTHYQDQHKHLTRLTGSYFRFRWPASFCSSRKDLCLQATQYPFISLNCTETEAVKPLNVLINSSRLRIFLNSVSYILLIYAQIIS